ncbi:hypothetical protein L226DRAFT_311927 [Lentinus tigrinus ALCF2SS1-7]|uniref:Uncharacterized protein n=1 Tax=Lentinus tigrinus ALCF2SS1-6 TaxID=1328759 RepID=A0A5C2RS32_9APHY|nr:hypothetical protein L227DRAFT_369883 [Lentinus tigrinus ALCF2SS1-6]RPD68846.1 hypothetical protein L226DRAFT_311927 [Lentinus tigrinus ALCF2SS1-7]
MGTGSHWGFLAHHEYDLHFLDSRSSLQAFRPSAVASWAKRPARCSGATRCIPVPVDADPFGLRGRAAQAGRGEPCAGHGMLHVSSARFPKRPSYVHLNHCLSHIRKSSAATLKFSNNQGYYDLTAYADTTASHLALESRLCPRATVAIFSSSAARPYLK